MLPPPQQCSLAWQHRPCRGDFRLIALPRAIAQERARAIARKSKPDDLLILIPEWYAPSFNHYFSAPMEQVDYPHEGRAGLIDFANVWARTIDSAATGDLDSRIAEARGDGRRVWLVSAEQYLRPVTRLDVATAEQHHQPGPLAALHVQQVRKILREIYGQEDSSLVASNKRPLYDNLRAYLFTPGR